MKQKLEDGRAIDGSECSLTGDGDCILEEFEEGVNSGDAKAGEWIGSIGGGRKTVRIRASTTGKFYLNPASDCLWLR